MNIWFVLLGVFYFVNLQIFLIKKRDQHVNNTYIKLLFKSTC